MHGLLLEWRYGSPNPLSEYVGGVGPCSIVLSSIREIVYVVEGHVDYNKICYQCGQYIGTGGCGCSQGYAPTWSPQYYPTQTIAYVTDPQVMAKLDEIVELLKELMNAIRNKGI